MREVSKQKANWNSLSVIADNIAKLYGDGLPFVYIFELLSDIDIGDKYKMEVKKIISISNTKCEAIEFNSVNDLIHVSPRGNGLKDYVRIDIKNFSHLDNFKALRYYYKEKHGLVIDEACKDIVRACFLCHDPNAYVSPQICPF